MEQNREELVSRLSYGIVQEVAPDELDLFDDFRKEFLKNPDAFTGKREGKEEDHMLGFAMGGAEQFIIPVVLPIVWNVLSYAAKTGFETIVKKVGEKVVVTLTDKDKPLSQEKIKDLRQYAITVARNLNVDDDKATIIANSLIGRMVST
jgi:hypothetical protein